MDAAVAFRLAEMDGPARAVRQGMAQLVPLPVIDLLTVEHLERLVRWMGLPCVLSRVFPSTARGAWMGWLVWSARHGAAYAPMPVIDLPKRLVNTSI